MGDSPLTVEGVQQRIKDIDATLREQFAYQNQLGTHPTHPCENCPPQYPTAF